jgi:hypothetical protein
LQLLSTCLAYVEEPLALAIPPPPQEVGQSGRGQSFDGFAGGGEVFVVIGKQTVIGQAVHQNFPISLQLFGSKLDQKPALDGINRLHNIVTVNQFAYYVEKEVSRHENPSSTRRSEFPYIFAFEGMLGDLILKGNRITVESPFNEN